MLLSLAIPLTRAPTELHPSRPLSCPRIVALLVPPPPSQLRYAALHPSSHLRVPPCTRRNGLLPGKRRGVNGNSDLARFKKILVREMGEATATAPVSVPAAVPAVDAGSGTPSAGSPSHEEGAPAPVVAVERGSPSHGEGDSAVAAAPDAVVAAAAAATSTTTDAAARGARVEHSTGDNDAVEDGVEDAGVELEGAGGTSRHVPGRRRSRWRRRFRRLLRRGDREEHDVAVAVVVGAENEGSRAREGDAANV